MQQRPAENGQPGTSADPIGKAPLGDAKNRLKGRGLPQPRHLLYTLKQPRFLGMVIRGGKERRIRDGGEGGGTRRKGEGMGFDLIRCRRCLRWL